MEQEQYKRCIQAQDACNLSGVVYEFADVLKALWKESDSTRNVNNHPLSVMYANKIAQLAGIPDGDVLTFQIAYDKVKVGAAKGEEYIRS